MYRRRPTRTFMLIMLMPDQVQSAFLVDVPNDIPGTVGRHRTDVAVPLVGQLTRDRLGKTSCHDLRYEHDQHLHSCTSAGFCYTLLRLRQSPKNLPVFIGKYGAAPSCQVPG